MDEYQGGIPLHDDDGQAAAFLQVETHGWDILLSLTSHGPVCQSTNVALSPQEVMEFSAALKLAIAHVVKTIEGANSNGNGGHDDGG